MRKRLAVAAGALTALFVILGLLGTGDVIDLPAWTDVKGVDIPLIGDTDAIDCRLRRVDDTTMVQIKVVDGDETTYASYVHVWNNGNLVDPEQIERIADDEFIVPSTPGAVEQFYSISIEPLREGRVFCESINIE